MVNRLCGFFNLDPIAIGLSIRAEGWRSGPGADLRRDPGGKLSVDGEAKCRGGEHGENS